MGIIRKVIKYGLVFALGYYLGSGGCASNHDYKKYSNLEQEVLKYEQKNINGYEPRIFPQESRRSC